MAVLLELVGSCYAIAKMMLRCMPFLATVLYRKPAMKPSSRRQHHCTHSRQGYWKQQSHWYYTFLYGQQTTSVRSSDVCAAVKRVRVGRKGLTL